MSEKQPLPIWFFIGLLLLLYGILILIAGIVQIAHPPATVLARLHPTFWGGVVLTVLGGSYVWIYRPRRS